MSQPSAQVLKIRRYVWTGAIAATVAVGTIYGAGLKIQKEEKHKIHQKHKIETSIDERIAILEEKRGQLIAKKIGLEKKLAELEARQNGATREESMVGRERKA